jgi:hypothetical protein
MGTCVPYTKCPEENATSCNKTCQNGEHFDRVKYYADDGYAIKNNVADIQTEIMVNGPVEGKYFYFINFYLKDSKYNKVSIIVHNYNEITDKFYSNSKKITLHKLLSFKMSRHSTKSRHGIF